VIKSFKDRDAAALFRGEHIAKHLRPLARVAKRKLDMLDYAEALSDLRSPPGNRLEALSGDRAGYHSIRINDQWRVCFRWRQGGAEEVEIVDYH
jgi:toxin HigB-1